MATQFNPLDDRSLRKLRDAIKWSRRQLSTFTRQYVDNLKMYVGKRYGHGGSSGKMPLNMARLAVDVWQRKLVTKSPEVLAITPNPLIKPGAHLLEMGMAVLLREINFAESLQEVTKLALLGFGAMRVGLSPRVPYGHPNYLFDPGQPYADPILWENWVHDFNARRKDEWDYAGDKSLLDYEEIMENPELDERAKRNIDREWRQGDDDDFGEGKEIASSISKEDDVFKHDEGEYRQRVEVWNLWLPMDNLEVQLPVQNDCPPLLIKEFEGPDNGPLHLLSFCQVPGNVMGSDPTSLLYDMNDLLNRMFVKIGRQGERQKTLLMVDPVAAGDGTIQRIKDASDGDIITATRPEAAKEVGNGGVNQNSMALTVWLRQMASYMGGNIDLLGGLSSQSPTARQDQILSESGSELVSYMQGEVETFTTRVCQDLAGLLHRDPILTLTLTHHVPGTDIEIPLRYGPEERDWDLYEATIQIIPYTLRSQSPEQRLTKILQIVTQVIGPLMPLAMQQGQQLNMAALLALIAKYSNLEELNDLFVKSGMPPMGQQGGGPERPGMPSNSERRYVRENVSGGGTANARDSVLMQTLLGGNSQVTPQQVASASIV